MYHGFSHVVDLCLSLLLLVSGTRKRGWRVSWSFILVITWDWVVCSKRLPHAFHLWLLHCVFVFVYAIWAIIVLFTICFHVSITRKCDLFFYARKHTECVNRIVMIDAILICQKFGIKVICMKTIQNEPSPVIFPSYI